MNTTSTSNTMKRMATGDQVEAHRNPTSEHDGAGRVAAFEDLSLHRAGTSRSQQRADAHQRTDHGRGNRKRHDHGNVLVDHRGPRPPPRSHTGRKRGDGCARPPTTRAGRPQRRRKTTHADEGLCLRESPHQVNKSIRHARAGRAVERVFFDTRGLLWYHIRIPPIRPPSHSHGSE
jgi:hypothetical protein